MISRICRHFQPQSSPFTRCVFVWTSIRIGLVGARRSVESSGKSAAASMIIDGKVRGVDGRVRGVDGRVRGVDG